MTNILLRYTNHFGRLPKNTLINECKKITNFKIQRYDKAFILLVVLALAKYKMVSVVIDYKMRYVDRNIQTMPQDKKKVNIFYQKFMNIIKHMEIHKSIQEKEIASIINLIHSAETIDSYQVNLLIKWCHRMTDCLPLERVKMAESLWMTLTLCNFKYSVEHYNSLLKLYISNEYDFSLVDLLKEMKHKHIDLNLYTYKLCIKYCCMKGNVSKGLMYLQSYNSKLPYPSTFIFNSLIMGYSQSGDIEKVNGILNIMKEQNIQLTSTTYFYVMCTYAKLNNIDKIKEIIRDCNLNNIYFTNNNIINVIYILAKNGHISNIDTMYQYLYKKKNVWNDEMDVILKLIDINQNQIVMNVLFHMFLNSDYSEFENALKIILKYMVTKSVVINDVVNICTSLKNEEIFKKSLLILLHYSLMYNNRLSLSLLRICKSHSKIKPHYFWPLLIKHANKYDLQGILDLFRIMINEFNISPCVNTLVDYVLPLSFGKENNIRDILVNHKISETVINNAYVLWKLQKFKIKAAYNYMRNFQGEYFYNIIINDLRRALLISNDTHSFICISYNLVDNVNSHSTSTLNKKLNLSKYVSMDRQLRDFMTDYPAHKILLRKILKELVLYNIRLEGETVKLIHKFLDAYVTHDVYDILHNLSNKDYKCV